MFVYCFYLINNSYTVKASGSSANLVSAWHSGSIQGRKVDVTRYVQSEASPGGRVVLSLHGDNRTFRFNRHQLLDLKQATSVNNMVLVVWLVLELLGTKYHEGKNLPCRHRLCPPSSHLLHIRHSVYQPSVGLGAPCHWTLNHLPPSLGYIRRQRLKTISWTLLW